MNRRDTVFALLALGAVPLAAEAQQERKVYRIGYLHAEAASPHYRSLFDALRSDLRNLGYVEGKNIVIEARWADGIYGRLPDLAAELVRLKVDVLVTHGSKASLAAKRATTTIPIVMAVTADAVAYGLVTSLAQPGGNITGCSLITSGFNEKRLEFLKEVMPRIAHVAVLLNPANTSSDQELKSIKAAAKSLKIELQPFEVRGSQEFDRTFSEIAKLRVDAIVLQSDTMFTANGKKIAAFAASKKIPSAGAREYAEAGGLIGYAQNTLELYHRTADFVDRILKGAKPADLPVEQPTKIELVVNLKTAKALGITIPQSILVRADQVIE